MNENVVEIRNLTRAFGRNVALDNVEGLRFDGTKLQGDWKWVRGAVETINFDATVRDGLVTGKAGQAELTGWLRSEE